MTTRSKAKTFS